MRELPRLENLEQAVEYIKSKPGLHFMFEALVEGSYWGEQTLSKTGYVHEIYSPKDVDILDKLGLVESKGCKQSVPGWSVLKTFQSFTFNDLGMQVVKHYKKQVPK
jgi:hypothetical protein